MSNAFFTEGQKVTGDLLKGFWMSHDIHELKVEALLLQEVLNNSCFSDCLAQDEYAFQITAFVENVTHCAC